MYPAGVNLATVQTGVYSTLESGQNLAVSITATASVTDIVWSTDGISGNPYMSQPFSNVCNVGENVGLNLLPTNLDKWWYNGEKVISGGANHAFSYTITAQALYQDAQGRQQPLGAPLTWQNVLIPSNNGVPGVIDLDMLAKDATGTALVTIPFPAWVQSMSDAMNGIAQNSHNYANNSSNFANNSSNFANNSSNFANNAQGFANNSSNFANTAHNFANSSSNFANNSSNFANTAHGFANDAANSANTAANTVSPSLFNGGTLAALHPSNVFFDSTYFILAGNTANSQQNSNISLNISAIVPASNVQALAVSGNYVSPPGGRLVVIELWGAGGSGGAGDGQNGAGFQRRFGGGGGAYARFVLPAFSGNAQVVIGAGGPSVSGAGNNGTWVGNNGIAGGATTFTLPDGLTLTASGGGAGANSGNPGPGSNPYGVGGGAGGSQDGPVLGGNPTNGTNAQGPANSGGSQNATIPNLTPIFGGGAGARNTVDVSNGGAAANGKGGNSTYGAGGGGFHMPFANIGNTSGGICLSGRSGNGGRGGAEGNSALGQNLNGFPGNFPGGGGGAAGTDSNTTPIQTWSGAGASGYAVITTLF